MFWQRPKQIKFAESFKVDQNPLLLDDFTMRVLHMDKVFISDESSLWDFHIETSNDELLQRIRDVYEVDASGIPFGNIALILERIAAKHAQSLLLQSHPVD